MPGRRTLDLLLLAAAALACTSAPRITVNTGTARDFDVNDRFSPANMGVLEMENPAFENAQLWDVRNALESAIGWRGLRMAVEEEADWLVSCAFRKRLKFPRDNSMDDVIEPWHPSTGDPLGRDRRVVGTETREPRQIEMDPTAPPPPAAPWVETFIELRLRSRRTGTVAWAAERRWARDRTEISEDELRDTLRLLLGEVRMTGTPKVGP